MSETPARMAMLRALHEADPSGRLSEMFTAAIRATRTDLTQEIMHELETQAMVEPDPARRAGWQDAAHCAGWFVQRHYQVQI